MKIFKEPLLHSLIIGVVLLVLFDMVNDGATTDNQVIVSAGRIDQLEILSAKTWPRPRNGSTASA